MGHTLDLLTEFYDAWDAGDPERFERVTRNNFAPDAMVGRPEEQPARMSDLLPLWLVEIDAWKPQRHEIQTVIELDDMCVLHYRWVATHNALLKTTDGREFPATGKEVTNNAVALVRSDGERIVEATALYSNYQDIIRQLQADGSETAASV